MNFSPAAFKADLASLYDWKAEAQERESLLLLRWDELRLSPYSTIDTISARTGRSAAVTVAAIACLILSTFFRPTVCDIFSSLSTSCRLSTLYPHPFLCFLSSSKKNQPDFHTQRKIK